MIYPIYQNFLLYNIMWQWWLLTNHTFVLCSCVFCLVKVFWLDICQSIFARSRYWRKSCQNWRKVVWITQTIWSHLSRRKLTMKREMLTCMRLGWFWLWSVCCLCMPGRSTMPRTRGCRWESLQQEPSTIRYSEWYPLGCMLPDKDFP